MQKSITLISIISFGISFILTPWARKFSEKCGMVDVPNRRKIHKKAIPYGGGIAIFFGFLGGLLLAGVWDQKIFGFLLGALIIVATGIYDDAKGLYALPKFLLQSLAATVAIYFGLQMDMGMLLRGHLSELSFLSIPLSFIWIVGVINAINLIDGLDGLAAGVSTISAFTLAAVSWVNGAHEVTLLSMIVGAASLGFLPHNFRTQVFMGDAGSMLLGYCLATLAIMGSVKLAAAFSLFVPIIILVIPLFDTIFAIVRRIASKKPVFEGDKKHLHHRLLELGFSPGETVSFIYLFSILFGGLAVLSAIIRPRYGYYVFLGSLISAIIFGITLIFYHQKKTGQKD